MRIGIGTCGLSFSFSGEAHKWWRSLDEDTIFHSTWESFEKQSSQINGLGIQKWRKCIELKMN